MDLDLSDIPYKKLNFHSKAIRGVQFSPKFPLFASCSDDGSIHVFHGKVDSVSLGEPVILPVKSLKGHKIEEGLGILDICFHPRYPWLMSAGADKEIILWT